MLFKSPLQLCLEIWINFFQTHATSSVSTVQLLYAVKEKGGKPDRKPYSLPYGLRNPYRNLKSENSQDYAQKPQRNCTFMNLSSEGFTEECDKASLFFYLRTALSYRTVKPRCRSKVDFYNFQHTTA